jgi:hypothetical protein
LSISYLPTIPNLPEAGGADTNAAPPADTKTAMLIWSGPREIFEVEKPFDEPQVSECEIITF